MEIDSSFIEYLQRRAPGEEDSEKRLAIADMLIAFDPKGEIRDEIEKKRQISERTLSRG